MKILDHISTTKSIMITTIATNHNIRNNFILFNEQKSFFSKLNSIYRTLRPPPPRPIMFTGYRANGGELRACSGITPRVSIWNNTTRAKRTRIISTSSSFLFFRCKNRMCRIPFSLRLSVMQPNTLVFPSRFHPSKSPFPNRRFTL